MTSVSASFTLNGFPVIVSAEDEDPAEAWNLFNDTLEVVKKTADKGPPAALPMHGVSEPERTSRRRDPDPEPEPERTSGRRRVPPDDGENGDGRGSPSDQAREQVNNLRENADDRPSRRGGSDRGGETSRGGDRGGRGRGEDPAPSRRRPPPRD